MKKTKRIILNAILALCATVSVTGCLNEYLDRAPDAGLTDSEVFSKYANFKSYFYSVYGGSGFNIRCHYPLHWCMNSQKLTLEELTDMCDKTRIQRAQSIKLGNGSDATWIIGYPTADSNYQQRQGPQHLEMHQGMQHGHRKGLPHPGLHRGRA